MILNEQGLSIIKDFEGLVDGDPDTPGLDPYLDPVGIPTIGWGSIWGSDGRRVTMDHPPISKNEAERLLAREVRHTERYVARLLKVPVTSNQFSALVSLTYNIGSGNLQASTLLRLLNRNQVNKAADEFPKWRRAGGRILLGLVRRRAVERQLFLTP